MTILTPDFDVAGAVFSDPRVGALDRGARRAVEAASDGALASDAQLYLRHVEGGETIRALARETGHHPSTILRRIAASKAGATIRQSMKR